MAYKKKFTKRCKGCKRTFVTTNMNNKFCTEDCEIIYNNREKLESLKKWRYCKNCGKKIPYRPQHFKHGHYLYCSDECLKQYWAKNSNEQTM